MFNWSAIDVTYNWSDSIHGNAEKISVYLQDLFSGDMNLAMKATHNLWCDLCHQHSYISSAALPAYDFLLEGLDKLNDKLKVEILDILLGFASCTSSVYYETANVKPLSWETELRQKLIGDIPKYKTLSINGDEDISYFAQKIVSNLTS